MTQVDPRRTYQGRRRLIAGVHRSNPNLTLLELARIERMDQDIAEILLAARKRGPAISSRKRRNPNLTHLDIGKISRRERRIDKIIAAATRRGPVRVIRQPGEYHQKRRRGRQALAPPDPAQ